MPRFNVKLPDGRWRVFGSVVENYITEPLTFDELREFRRFEYGGASCDEDTDTLLTDHPRINVMSYEEAERRVRELGWQ